MNDVKNILDDTSIDEIVNKYNNINKHFVVFKFVEIYQKVYDSRLYRFEDIQYQSIIQLNNYFKAYHGEKK